MPVIHTASGANTAQRDESLDILLSLNRALDPEWDETSDVLWNKGRLTDEQKKRGIVVQAEDKFVAVKELPEFEVSIWTESGADVCFMLYPPRWEQEFSAFPDEERLNLLGNQLGILLRKAYHDRGVVVMPESFLAREGSRRSTQHDPGHYGMDIFNVRIVRGIRAPRWDKTLTSVLLTLNAILAGTEMSLE